MLSTLSREYQMVTNKCGVIDMSWKGKIEVKGEDADALMNYAICTQVWDRFFSHFFNLKNKGFVLKITCMFYS